MAAAFQATLSSHKFSTTQDLPDGGDATAALRAYGANPGLISPTQHDSDFPVASPAGDSSTLADPQRKLLTEVMETALPWISRPYREELARSMPLRNVARRSHIAADAEIRSRLYLLVSGEAKLGFISRSSTKRLIALLSAGDFLGVMALVPEAQPPSLDSAIRSYYCEAINDCVVAEIEPEELTGFLTHDQSHLFASLVKQTVGGWLRLLMWRCGVEEFDVRGRLLANLSDLAERFGVQDKRGMVINLRVTEFDLAELIGASRPKVSTCLSNLEREGLVKRDRRRLILTHKAIRAFKNSENVGATADSSNGSIQLKRV
jgi:CRP/FNR family transcriptional regulator, cyclic AMP receptor protein